jgi:PadR family transcriptional regulator, regulatory protein PadR
MTPQLIALLEVLLEDPTREWYGFELCKAAELKSGTVYPSLARLERAEWLTSEWEDVDPSTAGRPRRRIYRLTGTGELAARSAVEILLKQLQRVRDGNPLNPRLRHKPA